MNIGKAVLHAACRSGDEAVLAWARFGHATGMFKLYQPLPDINLAMDTLGPRIQERLAATQKNLPPGPPDGLDIGSNIGFYASEIVKD